MEKNQNGSGTDIQVDRRSIAFLTAGNQEGDVVIQRPALLGGWWLATTTASFLFLTRRHAEATKCRKRVIVCQCYTQKTPEPKQQLNLTSLSDTKNITKIITLILMEHWVPESILSTQFKMN